MQNGDASRINAKLKKEIISKYSVWIIEFLCFAIIIYVAPVIGDRWMEMKTGISMEYSTRIVFSQIRWFQIANGRVFSNLFSYWVDGYNPILRAIINALMIVTISFSIHKTIGNNIVAAVVPFLISFGSWVEVIFYATTFYVSAAFILTIWCCYVCSRIDNENNDINILGGCILAVISCMWVENLSVLLCILFFGIIIYRKRLGLNCKHDIAIFLCGGAGTLLMFLSAKFATQGRLQTSGTETLQTMILSVGESLRYEYLMIIFYSVAILRLIILKEKNKRSKIVNIPFWIFVVFVNLYYLFERIYQIISTDPIEEKYVDVCGWTKFKVDVIDNIIELVAPYTSYFNIFLLIIATLSSAYIWSRLSENKKRAFFLFLIADVAGFLITILTMYQRMYKDTRYAVYADARVLYIFEILTGILAVWIYSQIDSKYNKTSKFIAVSLMLFIFWNQYEFVKPYALLADERCKVADLVYEKQLLQTWDYENDVMYFPQYEKNNIGDGLMGRRYNPDINDVYYMYMLNYYDLDEKTIIEYY